VLRYLERLAAHDVALRGVVTLRTAVYARLAAADPAVAADLRRGDLLSRLGADVEAIGDVVVRSLLPFATAALTAGLSVLAVALILPSAGLILAVAVLVAAVVAPALAGWAACRDLRDTAVARVALSSETIALLDGLPEFVVAGVVPERRRRLDRIEAELSRAQDRAARPAAWALALSTLTMGAAVVGCLLVGVLAVSDGRLPPVMLAVVTLVPLAVAEVTAALPGAATVLVRGSSAAERVAALLDAPAAVGSARDEINNGETDFVEPVVMSQRPRLTADGLDCGRAGGPVVLRGLGLDLPAGRRIAVVGPSGAGKSTLLLTLAGLLPPLRGRVCLDGQDLARLPIDRLRATIHFGADDAHVFTTTVRENLRVAAPGADDADLQGALGRAGLSGWLTGLPEGLDTIIGDPSGPGAALSLWPLSGGERRRLLVARAILSGAEILLIDEPAEHLDPATADALLAELFALGITVVVVTHRLAPLRTADEVLVLADGEVVARGRHEELLQNHQPYREAVLADEALVLSGAGG
jgi:ATP-binding cassette subfamily C protein CydC